MWTLVKANCVTIKKPKLLSNALYSNVYYNYFFYEPISFSLNVSGSFTITIQTHFFAKNYLLFRFNELFDTLIHNTSSETFTDFRFPFFN